MTNANTDLPGSQIAFGGLFRRHCNPQQFLGLTDQLCQLLVSFPGQFDCELSKSVPKQFKPEMRFIALLFDHTKFRDELNFGTRAESRAVVRSHRTAGTEQLITYMLSLVTARKPPGESDNIQSKSSRSHFQRLAHSRSLPVACHLHQPIREQSAKDEGAKAEINRCFTNSAPGFRMVPLRPSALDQSVFALTRTREHKMRKTRYEGRNQQFCKSWPRFSVGPDFGPRPSAFVLKTL
jgi:hypothetical protein